MVDRLIHLLFGYYSAHRSETVKQAAAKLGITLHFIPQDLADEFQPLDRVDFGVLKVQAKRPFHSRFHLNPRERRTKSDAGADIITA
jgi:hypothetical protein